MSRLREMRTHWSHAFRTRPVRATASMFMWIGMVVLGALAVFSIIYLVAGRGLQDPADEAVRRQEIAALGRGRFGVFATDSELSRAREGAPSGSQRSLDANDHDMRRSIEDDTTALVDLALAPPAGADIVQRMTAVGSGELEGRFCMVPDAKDSAAELARHYQTRGWLATVHDTHDPYQDVLLVEGSFGEATFVATVRAAGSKDPCSRAAGALVVVRVVEQP